MSAGAKRPPSASFSKESTKGNAFEELCVAFLANDPAMRMVCRNPMLRKRWAEIHGRYGKDAGIDFITEIPREEGLCAVPVQVLQKCACVNGRCRSNSSNLSNSVDIGAFDMMMIRLRSR